MSLTNLFIFILIFFLIIIISAYSNNGVVLKPVDEKFTIPERITYDEALTKYGTGRFVIFQYGKSIKF